MGMVDDLAQARTDYEQGDWTAALDIWSDIEPDDMSADDLHDAALAAYLLGRRDASVDFHQRGSRGTSRRDRRPGRCAAASTSR